LQPASIANLLAVKQALVINDSQGEALRSRLVQLVKYFRRRLQPRLSLGRGFFRCTTLAARPI
jgi:hypothetical protein